MTLRTHALLAGAILNTLFVNRLTAQSTSPASAPSPVSDLMPHETVADRDARMAWWREARFGMFIHWGLYAVPAGEWNGKQEAGLGEWLMHRVKIPVADYAKLAGQFNPTKFDADAWVKLAKDAGMKYIVITSKHHDGFAMFKSEASPFNIVDATPFKRDPLKELAAACQKQGIKLGFYYSQNQDWHHPGGDAYGGGHWDKAQNGDYDAYLRNIAVPQVREILTNYGPISVLWFDTPNKQMTRQQAEYFMPLLKSQPNLVVNNRLGGGFQGDTATPEQHIPANGFPGRDWETCMTINTTWGFKTHDQNFKSTETLLRNLIDIASKAGNYLLNVGPDATGAIPQPEVERLEQMGKWLAINGEAIYGTGPTPFGPEAGKFSDTEKDKNGKPLFKPDWKWRCTTKPGKLYLHLFEWPASGAFELDGVKQKVTKAYLLADPQRTPLDVQQNDGHLTLGKLPAKALVPIATVICVETESK